MDTSSNGRFATNSAIGSLTKNLSKPGVCIVLALSASLSSAAPPANQSKTNPEINYDCEYADAATAKEQPRRTYIRFDPQKPYTYWESFGFGHTVHSVVVTPEQVIEQFVAIDNPRHPERVGGISFTTMDRRTLAFRQYTMRIDPESHEAIVESDRKGTCVLNTNKRR